jgi:bifunctional non-homologous end joining protein LigD
MAQRAAVTPFPPSPMLATAAALPRDSAGYVFEAKWDGIRALARVDGRAELFSRHATNLTGYFPEITDGLAAGLAGRTAILDGEVVALDRRARPSFDLIQRRLRHSRPPARILHTVPAMFFVFDLLYLDGTDVMRRPYLERRKLLDALQLRGSSLQTSPYWTDIGAAAMFDVVRDMGLEGVVCKRATSVYQPGRRSQNWIKSVVRQHAPLVVGGWVPGRTGHIGSLLVGGHDDAGALMYCGQVGFGFSTPMRNTLTDRFVGLDCRRSPFANMAHFDGAQWVTPSIVVNIDYREFTSRLRHPSLKGVAQVEPRSVRVPGSTTSDLKD